MVKGVCLLTKHVKPRRQGEKGGIKKEEGFIHASNVMPVCPVTKKPTRVHAKITEAGKVRVSRQSKEAF